LTNDPRPIGLAEINSSRQEAEMRASSWSRVLFFHAHDGKNAGPFALVPHSSRAWISHLLTSPTTVLHILAGRSPPRGQPVSCSAPQMVYASRVASTACFADCERHGESCTSSVGSSITSPFICRPSGIGQEPYRLESKSTTNSLVGASLLQ